MRTLSYILVLSAIATTSFAQGTFTIHGKISLLTKSKTIRLIGYDPVPIRPDGVFEIKGETQVPHLALIMTDSSGADAIWLEGGEYTINCQEAKLPDIKGVVFRTPFLKGPSDAERYNDFQKQLYSGFGVTTGNEGDPANRKARQKENAARYMDSILNANNSSPALPDMIRSVQSIAGDDTTKSFIQRLTPELRGNGAIVMLENDFKRKEKISREKVFENFILIDLADSSFSLASLSGKKAILIDFWSSSCGPCRLGHPRLKEWYAKYADKGLGIVSISIDENKEQWLKAVREDGIGSWTNVYDPNGFKANLMQDYYIPYIPFRFLLDAKRNIIMVDNAQDSWIREKDIAAILDK